MKKRSLVQAQILQQKLEQLENLLSFEKDEREIWIKRVEKANSKIMELNSEVQNLEGKTQADYQKIKDARAQLALKAQTNKNLESDYKKALHSMKRLEQDYDKVRSQLKHKDGLIQNEQEVHDTRVEEMEQYGKLKAEALK